VAHLVNNGVGNSVYNRTSVYPLQIQRKMSEHKPIKVEVVPKYVLDLVEVLRKYRKDGVQLIVGQRRRAGMTWAQQILDAEDAQSSEQKSLTNE
jgi:hypothetical protein